MSGSADFIEKATLQLPRGETITVKITGQQCMTYQRHVIILKGEEEVAVKGKQILDIDTCTEIFNWRKHFATLNSI